MLLPLDKLKVDDIKYLIWMELGGLQ
jgi:hypothetical protein